jgi:hypothetical protein
VEEARSPPRRPPFFVVGRTFDGAELARFLAAHPGSIETALAAYEEAMFRRSAQAAVEASETFAICFADERAPRKLIELLSGGATNG